MTREEQTISNLKKLKSFHNGSYGADIDRAIKALEQEPCDDMGEVSDGYHTFNQLYHQRAVLFATIVNSNKDKAWKSFKHSDGKYCFDSDGEWFIVGVDTPQGSYTYHYEKKYWDMFDCKELQCGKKWDGHTEEDVTRLLSLEQESCEDAISRQAVLDLAKKGVLISNGNYESVCKAINELPPVSPQAKTGHWIKWYEKVEYKDWTDYMLYCKCSECGKQYDPHLSQFIQYCSKCGTRMVEPQESEDKTE